MASAILADIFLVPIATYKHDSSTTLPSSTSPAPTSACRSRTSSPTNHQSTTEWPPEELEDADLQEAMQELGIPDEEVSEGDVEESS